MFIAVSVCGCMWPGTLCLDSIRDTVVRKLLVSWLNWFHNQKPMTFSSRDIWVISLVSSVGLKNAFASDYFYTLNPDTEMILSTLPRPLCRQGAVSLPRSKSEWQSALQMQSSSYSRRHLMGSDQLWEHTVSIYLFFLTPTCVLSSLQARRGWLPLLNYKENNHVLLHL